MDHFLGVAREKGVTDEQIGAVLSIVMAVSAGRVRAQFQDACALDKAGEQADPDNHS